MKRNNTSNFLVMICNKTVNERNHHYCICCIDTFISQLEGREGYENIEVDIHHLCLLDIVDICYSVYAARIKALGHRALRKYIDCHMIASIMTVTTQRAANPITTPGRIIGSFKAPTSNKIEVTAEPMRAIETHTSHS